ncbi:MAG: S46 family peptidase, partial [Nannocystaceae bacterium]
MPRARYFRISPSLALATAVLLPSACANTHADGADTQLPAPAVEAPKPAFENPGGMWMPTQIGAHAEALKHAGLELDPSVLTDPTSFPLGAIVSLGGCSASFVSNEGLIITNHHCVGRYLQSNSTPESNLLENGFLANTRAEEKSGGPRARVFVTQAFTDVTDKVLGGLDKVTDDKERYKTIAERRKQLINTCEQDRPDTRCLVSSFFEGAQFFQIEQLEIRDVRLVYAPHPGIGVYGGEIDNWRWPRHTGDFSFLRAYVGKDGKPADFAADNIPYTPPHHLKVASEKTKAGDFVMVAGYPGRTTRLKTAGEVREAADWTYNYRIQMYEEYIAVLKQLSELDPELKIKAAGRLRGLSNYYTNFKGMRDGLNQGGLASEKEKLEGELQTWINADQARKAKYGDVLAKIGELNAQRKQTRESDAAFSGILRGSSLLGTALDLLKWADQREKPDAERKRGYQEKDVADDVVAYESMQKTYDPRLDRAVFKLFLTRAAKLPEDKRPS